MGIISMALYMATASRAAAAYLFAAASARNWELVTSISFNSVGSQTSPS